MTAINRLTNKPNLADNDLIPIWDAQAGRTRNITFDTIKKSLKYVEDLTVNGSVLTVHYSDGSQKDLNI